MPVEINLGMPPVGYSITAARKDEPVVVQIQEFTSTEDGQHFVQRLEGLPDDILRKLPCQVSPSVVDSLLAICRRDGTATVYLNELVLKSSIRVSRPIEKDEPVFDGDIVDLERVELGVEIPADAGVLFLFSTGWRKGLYYDFSPIGSSEPKPRNYDLSAAIGQAYCHVKFQERFKITDAEWDLFYGTKWFPFAGLSHRLIDLLIGAVRSGWNPDEYLKQVATELEGKSLQLLEAWRSHTSFQPHIEILDCAVNRFLSGDFISCTGLLFPRIEGLLRTHAAHAARVTQRELADSAVAAKIDNEKCLLMPQRFARYLKQVYFADFGPTQTEIEVSRNSVGHGVAHPADFNQKSAVIAILVLHQLFYFLESKKPRVNENSQQHE